MRGAIESAAPVGTTGCRRFKPFSQFSSNSSPPGSAHSAGPPRDPAGSCVFLAPSASFCVRRGSKKRGLARMERLFAVLEASWRALGPSGPP